MWLLSTSPEPPLSYSPRPQTRPALLQPGKILIVLQRVEWHPQSCQFCPHFLSHLPIVPKNLKTLECTIHHPACAFMAVTSSAEVPLHPSPYSRKMVKLLPLSLATPLLLVIITLTIVGSNFLIGRWCWGLGWPVFFVTESLHLALTLVDGIHQYHCFYP